MLFNLSWNDRKSKISIAIIDDEELPSYIYIKKDLSNAFNKKMIKKIIKKMTLKKGRIKHYQIKYDLTVVEYSKNSHHILNQEIVNNIKTLKMILKELIEDIVCELKLSYKEKVYA